MLNLGSNSWIVSGGNRFNLGNVLLDDSAFTKSAYDEAHIFEARFQIGPRIYYPIRNGRKYLAGLGPHGDGVPRIIRAFTFNLVEGLPVVLGGRLPFNEKIGHLVEHASDLIAGNRYNIGSGAFAVFAPDVKGELVVLHGLGNGSKPRVTAQAILAVDLAVRAV